MSIILKGIDLPKGDTTEVVIRIQPNGEVKDSHGILLAVKAVQIPKGHGRVIDGNEIQAILIKEAYSGEHTERFPLGSTIKWTPTEAQRIINDNVPTILEVEE